MTEERIKQTIESHQKMVADLQSRAVGTIKAIAGSIVNSLEKGGMVFLCGNGGSAADAQHVSGELVGRFERERKGLAAVSLTTDTSTLTSVANDYGYENIFKRQVEALARAGDILWAFSTSGSSENVINAALSAHAIGAEVIAFTGKKASKLEEISDICLCCEGMTPRVQEVQQLAYHIICDLVEECFTNH